MIIMVNLNRAAVLFLQLIQMWLLLAGSRTADIRTVLVSRGDSYTFTCNVSYKNATQIMWTKDTQQFVYSINLNKSCSNFSSPQLSIDPDIPSKLIISSVQREDAGLYNCHLYDIKGFQMITWNLTVFDSHEDAGITLSRYIMFILPPTFGVLLGCIIIAACLCRKPGTTVEIQELVQTHLQSQFEGQDLGTNRKQRRGYKEKLNSIYVQSEVI